MQETRKFPLAVWEATKECKEEYEQANQRFQDISKRLYARKFTCTYLGGLTFDDNCIPQVWLNDNRNIYKHDWKPEEAVEHAKIHGHFGWWNLDQLEQFVQGQGPILEEGMWGLGFRKNKTNPEKWARLTAKDKEHGSPLHYQLWDEKHGKVYAEVSDEESKRLPSLLVMPNESLGIEKTYNITARKRGIIYVELLANPFAGHTAETLWMFGEQMSNRGHIAKQQDGFYINARNIQLEKQDYVHIKAFKPDRDVECLWPSQIPTERIYDLADDLVARVKL